MRFSWSKIFFYAMIILGFIGLITFLMNNPVLLLTRILVGAAVIAIIIFVYRVVTGQNKGQNAGYKRAVRQSKKRKREHKRDHVSRPKHLQVIQSRSLIKKKTSEKRGEREHLKVIDGKKNRKGNSSF